MKQVKIETTGKYKLNTYIHGIENKQTAIILCHGFSWNSSWHFTPELAEELSDKYLVCRFDFRGQGNSEWNFYNTSITNELEDLDHIVKYIKKNYLPKKIILIGHSFGAAIALLYTSLNKIDGLISLSWEWDLEKAITYEFTEQQLEDFKTKWETMVENWSKDGNKELLGKQFLDDLFKYSTVDAAKKLQCPVLFVHGKNDNIIPHSATENIYKLIKSPKEIKLIDNTDHIYNFFTDNPKTNELFLIVKDWLYRHF